MSLKIITFANHKGGVSKTTSTASIGKRLCVYTLPFIVKVLTFAP